MSQLLDAEACGLPFRLIELALVPSDRGELHRRIEARFDACEKRARGGAQRCASAMHCGPACLRCAAVGYRQAWQFLDGSGLEGDVRDAVVFWTRSRPTSSRRSRCESARDAGGSGTADSAVNMTRQSTASD